MTFFFNISS